MSQNSTSSVTGVLYENDAETIDGGLIADIPMLKHANDRKMIVIWYKVFLYIYSYLAAVYGIWLAVTGASVYTNLFATFLYVISMLGVTAGAHRLWAHRSYKAKTPLKILLIIFNSIAFQDCAYRWARDHRLHHKYSETDADPYNRMRGFFFAHVGWSMCRKHPEVFSKCEKIDISDLISDPILQFQKKYFLSVMAVSCFILPTIIPMYGWNESYQNAFFIAAMLRWIMAMNSIFLVNSLAHQWGNHPYDKAVNPTERPSVSFLALGEGWHNYHHVFPWDYKAAELGNYGLNVTTAFIDLCSKIGWAYDLKTVSTDIIEKRVKRTGDGTHPTWGWGDKDQDDIEIKYAYITHQKDG